MDVMDNDEELDLQVICVITSLVEHYYANYVHKTPCMNSSFTGNKWLKEILDGNKKRCQRMFRMEKCVFLKLCNDLESNYGLHGSRRLTALEALGIFLFILGHGAGNRLAQERFQHSGETISRYFNMVLDAICLMSVDILKAPDLEFKKIPEEILRDARYMPHFQNCIGAIDGVHVHASISPEDQVPFIGRKGMPTQNIMAICNFNMEFIYAYAGWEGSAHDARIFLSALHDPIANFPKPPEGKYYLVDAGYPQLKGFLGPYKGQRYHLQQFRDSGPATGYKEVFNHAHSSLRSVIERTFGVWKKCWKILRDMPSYPFEKQVKIVVATMTLHNYIRRHVERDRQFEKLKKNPDQVFCEINQPEIHNVDEQRGRSHEMDNVRNNIAASLMRV